MDTRFWGPDGWKLFHSIVAGYPNKPTVNDKYIYGCFFKCLRFVLPCIYCRISFKEYGEKLPIDNYLDSKDKLCKWLYDIHNLVNNKLRNQGFLHEEDPKYSDIYAKYNNYVAEINKSNCTHMPGWDFIYCIYFNYPEKFDEDALERIVGYAQFLLVLPHVLPFISAKNAILSFKYNLSENLMSRDKAKELIYYMEKHVKDSINCNCISFSKRCTIIENYRAGCKKNKDGAGTCRKNT